MRCKSGDCIQLHPFPQDRCGEIGIAFRRGRLQNGAHGDEVDGLSEGRFQITVQCPQPQQGRERRAGGVHQKIQVAVLGGFPTGVGAEQVQGRDAVFGNQRRCTALNFFQRIYMSRKRLIKENPSFFIPLTNVLVEK